MSTTWWWATGLLFENCNCQLLCPGHVSFKQHCTHERCQGNWAIHLDESQFGGVSLSDLNAAVIFDAPQRMYDGGWTQVAYIDERATTEQRTALDDILAGRVGGPWAILGRFVEKRLETRFVTMCFDENDGKKRLVVPDLFETTITAIRGADGKTEARIENLHNVAHGPTHVLARGRTRCKDPAFDFLNVRTHGLYSHFSWNGDH